MCIPLFPHHSFPYVGFKYVVAVTINFVHVSEAKVGICASSYRRGWWACEWFVKWDLLQPFRGEVKCPELRILFHALCILKLTHVQTYAHLP